MTPSHAADTAEDTFARTPTASPEPTDPRPFGPGSMLWDGAGDIAYLATTASAFMLQVMHPTISTAVDRQSVFRTDPFGRLVRSMDSVMLWVYGGQAAAEEGARLRELHKTINGVDDAGERYHALDPEAYAWVHATAFVTSATTYPLLHGRELRGTEERRAYEEHLQLGRILRIPERMMPATPSEYWQYYHQMVNDRLSRTVVADELLRMTSTPPLPFSLGPLDALLEPARRVLGHPLYLLTVGGMTGDAHASHAGPARPRPAAGTAALPADRAARPPARPRDRGDPRPRAPIGFVSGQTRTHR
jgi:uncharacterized protein (DUF2236 family)